MRYVITFILAAAIFACAGLFFYWAHVQITGDVPNYRVRGPGGLLLFIAPWLLASFLVKKVPIWTKESAINATRASLKAQSLISHGISEVTEEAKRRELHAKADRLFNQEIDSHQIDRKEVAPAPQKVSSSRGDVDSYFDELDQKK